MICSRASDLVVGHVRCHFTDPPDVIQPVGEVSMQELAPEAPFRREVYRKSKTFGRRLSRSRKEARIRPRTRHIIQHRGGRRPGIVAMSLEDTLLVVLHQNNGPRTTGSRLNVPESKRIA